MESGRNYDSVHVLVCYSRLGWYAHQGDGFIGVPVGSCSTAGLDSSRRFLMADRAPNLNTFNNDVGVP